jgi:beta-phosphoglucomutase
MVVFPGGLQADAVIFDFDGVIVDTEPLHYRAFQRVLEPLGLGFSWQEYVETYMGFDDRDAFIEVFSVNAKPVTSPTLHDLINLKASLFQKVILDGINTYPGVISLIKKLHNESIPLAISSGALHSDIAPILKMLEIEDCFDVIIAADDVTKSKPDPECYRLAFDMLSSNRPNAAIAQSRTIAIEDTPAGIIAAKAAGLQVIAVTNSYPREQISDSSSIVSSLEELLDFRVT